MIFGCSDEDDSWYRNYRNGLYIVDNCFLSEKDNNSLNDAVCKMSLTCIYAYLFIEYYNFNKKIDVKIAILQLT